MKAIFGASLLIPLCVGLCGHIAVAQELGRLADVNDVIPAGYASIDYFSPVEGAIVADSSANGFTKPTYGIYHGKVVFSELSILMKDLTAGENWPTLPGLEHLSPIDHASFLFEPHGHGPSSEPDYVLRVWYAPASELAKMVRSQALKGFVPH